MTIVYLEHEGMRLIFGKGLSRCESPWPWHGLEQLPAINEGIFAAIFGIWYRVHSAEWRSSCDTGPNDGGRPHRGQFPGKR